METVAESNVVIAAAYAHRVQASEIFIARMDFTHLPLGGKCRDQP